MAVHPPLGFAVPGGVLKRYRGGAWRDANADPGLWEDVTADGGVIETELLAATDVDWQSSEAVTVSYQWLRDGVAIDPLPVNTEAPSVGLDE